MKEGWIPFEEAADAVETGKGGARRMGSSRTSN